MKFLNKITSLLFLLASMLLVSCSSDNSDKFVIATSPDNPPYEFFKSGKVVGFDIDLAEALAKKMDKELDLKNMDFSGLIPALSSGRVDAVIAAISATESRKKHVDFSDVYNESRVAILSKKISLIKDMKSLEGKRVGVQLGTSWEQILRQEIKKQPSINMVNMTNNLSLIEELKNNRVSAVVLEKKQAEKFSEQYPEFSFFLMDDSNISKFVVVLQKDSKHREKINKAIESLRADGTLEILERKWLR